jgi:hypothetical protein
VFGVEHRGVEIAQARADAAVVVVEAGPLVAQPLAPRLQPRDLVADEVQPDRAQLVDEPVVTPGRVGLSLQRREPASHLAEQVLEA